MRHVIIGGGNLGLDILGEIKREGAAAAELYSSSNGFDVQNSRAVLELMAARRDVDVLWYCVGAGGRAGVEEHPELAEYLLVTLPLLLARVAPRKTALCFFSSADVACEDHPSRPDLWTGSPRSEWARLCLNLERSLHRIGRPLTSVVRLSALYGTHKPSRTFPGRMLSQFGFERDLRMRLALNEVTPTPSLWAAAMLTRHIGELFDEDVTMTHHCAPRGNVSLRDWATFILEGLRDHRDYSRDAFFDPKAPATTALGCSLIGNDIAAASHAHWHDCWSVYFSRAAFTPRDRLAELGELVARAPRGERGKPAS